MAIVYLTSTTGAPGVSTLATALTLHWPRPALLLEADTSKTSHLIPGYLQAAYKHSHGLTDAAVASLRGNLDGEVLMSQTISLGEGRYAIPGFNDLGGARGSTPTFWSSLTYALGQLPDIIGAPDLDIFVDAGRYHTGDNRGALLAHADAVLIVATDTLPDINGLFTISPSLMKLLESSGHQDYAQLILTKSPHKNPFGPTHIGAAEIRSLTGMSTLETMPWEPAAAAHYSHGAPAPTKKSTWLRKLDDLIAQVDKTLESRRFTLAQGEE